MKAAVRVLQENQKLASKDNKFGLKQTKAMIQKKEMASLDFSKMSDIEGENGVKVPYDQRCELWLNSLNPHKQAFTQRL